jgi:hypothetical protein
MLGPAPIQQQLFNKVDMTDQNVLLINSILRRKIHHANGRLADLCVNVDIETMVYFPDKNGNIVEKNATRTKLAKVMLQNKINITKEEMALVQRLQSMSLDDRQAKFGNRRVFFSEINNFLRPRPECYKDKVHDHLDINGSALFWGEHSKLIEKLIILRAMAEP